MAEQGEVAKVMVEPDGLSRHPRESGEVPLPQTIKVPGKAVADTQVMAADPSERDTLPIGPPPEGGEGLIELPASRRVTQPVPHEQAAEDDDGGIIGLPTDVLRIESDLEQDDDGEILGLPSLLPGAAEEAGEIVGSPRESFSEIPPPPPVEPWKKRPADAFDLDDEDLDDTIIYPSEE